MRRKKISYLIEFIRIYFIFSSRIKSIPLDHAFEINSFVESKSESSFSFLKSLNRSPLTEIMSFGKKGTKIAFLFYYVVLFYFLNNKYE